MPKSSQPNLLDRILEWYTQKGALYLKAAFLLPNTGCRFCPTCSQYAKQAIKKYGPLKGTVKAIWRILRCNPYSKGGFDYP